MQTSRQLHEVVDELLTHYPPDKKRSALLMVLHAIQERNGHISDEMIEWTAGKLEIPAISVYEVVTFYPMFRRLPVGKYHIKICRTLSCQLAGSDKLCEELKKLLNLKAMDETTADGRFTISWVECLANCCKGPCMMVNDTTYDKLTKEKAEEILRQLN